MNVYAPPNKFPPGQYPAPQKSQAPLIVGVILMVLAFLFLFFVVAGFVFFLFVRAGIAEAQSVEQERRAEAEQKTRELESELDSLINGQPGGVPDDAWNSNHRDFAAEAEQRHREFIEEHDRRIEEMEREMDEQMKQFEQDLNDHSRRRINR